ncbi:hypothetical protein EV363DRAFT_619919 [Boletus edulis]|nr:hypothetical protein EV363DRAFT_619919 [Boletus edulis]
MRLSSIDLTFSFRAPLLYLSFHCLFLYSFFHGMRMEPYWQCAHIPSSLVVSHFPLVVALPPRKRTCAAKVSVTDRATSHLAKVLAAPCRPPLEWVIIQMDPTGSAHVRSSPMDQCQFFSFSFSKSRLTAASSRGKPKRDGNPSATAEQAIVLFLCQVLPLAAHLLTFDADQVGAPGTCTLVTAHRSHTTLDR